MIQPSAIIIGCLPCASWSLITLVVVTYARQHVETLLFGLFQPQGCSDNKYGPRSFAVAGPSTWNSLPAPLRNCHLTSTFRRDLKTELFIRAYH